MGASFLCSENHLHLWMHHHGVTMNRPSAFVFLSGWAPLVAQSREHNIRAWHRSPWGQRCSSSSSGMGKGICLSPRWRYRKESGPIPYPTQDTGEPGRGQAHRYDRIFFIAFPVDYRGSKRIRLCAGVTLGIGSGGRICGSWIFMDEPARVQAKPALAGKTTGPETFPALSVWTVL